MRSESEFRSRWALILLLVFILGCVLSFRVGLRAGETRGFLLKSPADDALLVCDVPPPDAMQQACNTIFETVEDAISAEASADAQAKHDAGSELTRD